MSEHLVKDKTNLLVVNALAGVVENAVERVFDFTVAEDVIVNFLKGSPSIEGYDMARGPWNHRGAMRIVRAEGGQGWRETITDFQRPHYFAYDLTEFSGGPLPRLADLATGQFIFMPYGPRTLVKWFYSFRASTPEHMPELRRFVTETWYAWQRVYLEGMTKALARDPWSA